MRIIFALCVCSRQWNLGLGVPTAEEAREEGVFGFWNLLMEMGAGGNEAEIGMPMSVSYGHMAAIHEANSKPSNSNMGADNCSTASDQEIRPLSHEAAAAAAAAAVAKPRSVKYRECLKNHAASIGGHANDGCGEFMPSGDEGTLEALKCAACGCHRNFHRRDTTNNTGVPDPSGGAASCYYCCYGSNGNGSSCKRPGGGVLHLPLPSAHVPLALPSSPSGIPRSHPQMIMAIRDVEDHDHMMSGAGAHAMYMAGHAMKKRFRTKFTQEQKDKMCAFAEKLGWRIQKHDDLAVQQFCMDIGVKRHVLKVWMHNNKHTLAKKP